MSEPTSLPGRFLRGTTEALVLRELKRAFRRVVWVGDLPPLPKGRPIVVYANHHGFHDGHLLWLLAQQAIGRPIVLWMERWEIAPFFSTVGALPFPADDDQRRFRTLRETARRLRENPETILLLFPEGELLPADSPVDPFKTDFARLARVLPPDILWWPVALRTTWWGEDHPTALLAGGAPAEALDGREFDHLRNLVEDLAMNSPSIVENGEGQILLEGRKSAEERWNFSRLAPFFQRWT